MTHEDCGMSIKTKGGKTYERESVRHQEKEKRKKKEKETFLSRMQKIQNISTTRRNLSLDLCQQRKKKDSFTLRSQSEQKKRTKRKKEKK